MSLLLLALVSAASAQLALEGIRCGQLKCQLDEYCSSETNRCAPCSVVCNKTHHNYDSGLCSKECQVYLLDQRYMQRDGAANQVHEQSNNSLIQSEAALIFSVIALVLMIIFLIIHCRGKLTWRYIKQKFQPSKNRVKQYPTSLTHHNPHAEMPKPNRDLKLTITNPEPSRKANIQPLNPKDLDNRTSHTERSAGETTPKTISTALSNRHPAEDTTLDYSYDNMGMNVTPPEKPTISQRF